MLSALVASGGLRRSEWLARQLVTSDDYNGGATRCRIVPVPTVAAGWTKHFDRRRFGAIYERGLQPTASSQQPTACGYGLWVVVLQ